jgi:uncharacterized membrane protein YkoI
MQNRRMKKILALVLAASISSSASAKSKPLPKITMAQAKATAQKSVAGKIKSAELETEKGKLVYSFDIVTDSKKIMEVLVDAMTGEVVEVVEETLEHEKQEQIEDHKRAKKQ